MTQGKINFVQLQRERPRGIVVGSLFFVPKIGGYSLKWKGRVRDAEGNLVNITGRDLIQNLLEAGCFDSDSQGRTKGMLVMANGRKREGKRDPDFLIYAYPSEEK